jgi:hypothetical protein
MAAFKCESCGAPFAPEPSQTIVTCGYCGASNRVGRLATMALRVSTSRDPVRLGRIVVGLVVGPIVFTVVFGIVVAVVIASAANSATQQLPSGLHLPGMPGQNAATDWDRQSTLECGINETVRITGEVTLPSGPIVRTGINCRVEITNATLSVGSGTVIEVGAPNAQIHITGSTLRGDTIVEGGMTTTVHVTDSALHATRLAIRAEGMAGGVRVEGASTVEGATGAIALSMSTNLHVSGTSKVASAGEAIVTAGGEVVIDGGTVEGGRTAISTTGGRVDIRAGSTVSSEEGDAIRGHGNLQLTVRDATVRAGRDAVAGGMNPHVSITGGSIEGTTAFRFEGNAHLELDGVRVTGARELGRRPDVTER